MTANDVIIIGAGAIGAAAAWILAQRGISVLLLERDPGASQAASRAAAGMLSAVHAHAGSEALGALCRQSLARWAEFAPRLADASGADFDFRRAGSLHVALDDAQAAPLGKLVAEQRARGVAAELVDGARARAIEPALGEIAAAAYFPDECAVDPPALHAALLTAAERAGAKLKAGARVARIDAAAGEAWLDGGERLRAGQLVIAGGAWSAAIAASGIEGRVRPIRGQMLELLARRPPALLVEGPDAYLSARRDGRVLVGSTVEDVGFEAGVTCGVAGGLLAGAVRLAPRLAEAKLARHWSGFRPAAADALPIIGRARSGAIVATAHFRNGIVLCPVTAQIVAALVSKDEPPCDLAPFSPDRFG